MKVMCKTGPGGCLSVTTTTTDRSNVTTTTIDSSTVTTTTTTTTDSSTTVTSNGVQTGCGDLVEENIGYKGAANIKSFNDGSVTDFSSCAQECFDFEGCNFWTFTNSGKCHLKRSDNGRENRGGFTSGQKPCG